MAETSATEYPAMLVSNDPFGVLPRDRRHGLGVDSFHLELVEPGLLMRPSASENDVLLIAMRLRHTSNQPKQSTPSMTA